MIRVVLAPDKFKGTLTAAEVAEHLAAGIASARPDVDAVRLPVADGGEGTLDAAIAAGFTRVEVKAAGPTGLPLETTYVRRADEAVVELAAVSGLQRLPGGRLQPLTATSFGTGEVVAAALDAGCRRIVLAVGGSACTDGGAGLLIGLGARVTDASGRPVPLGGAGLEKAAELDLTGLHPALRDSEIVLACDVDNPLLGPRGAAAVYGPQKGADTADVARLEAGLTRWSELVADRVGADRSGEPGAGAAGGVGFAALAVLGAGMRRGIDVVLDLVRFDDAVRGAGLVVTGEGAFDAQTLHGKAPAGVAATAGAAGVPVVVVAGRSELSREDWQQAGFADVYPLTELADEAHSLRRPGPLLERIGARVAAEHLGGDR